MILNIINLKKREERLLSIAKQAKWQECEIRIWEGVIHEKAATGISRAFKRIVQDAKERNLEMVCIGEDDLLFTEAGAWQYFLDNIPPYFDIYIGSYYSGMETFNNRIEGFRGMTLVLIHQRFFDKFISADEEINIDHALDYLGEYFVCPKFVAIQASGYSDQMKQYVDHADKIPQHKLFTGQ